MTTSISSTPPRVILPTDSSTATKLKQFAAETSAQVLTTMVSFGVFGALGLGFKMVGAVGSTLSHMCTVQNMWRIPIALPTGKITSLFLNKLAKQPKPESSISLAINAISASTAAIASTKFLKYQLGYTRVQDDVKTFVFNTISLFVVSNFLMEFKKFEKLNREMMEELDSLEEIIEEPASAMIKTEGKAHKG